MDTPWIVHEEFMKTVSEK